MQVTYAAYGLHLRSCFELPGMRATSTDGQPSILLERTTPAELDAAWSGPAGPTTWRGVLGDGCELTIEHGLDGDLLFSYGDRARFRLDRGRFTLQCAPSQDGLHWRQVLLGRILPNVSLECGYEALHASAVDSPEGIVAVAAPSGMGKTTLATELMLRGWPLFADDVVTLSSNGARVQAHSGTPLMNIATDRADQTGLNELGTTLAVLAGERWTAVTNATAGTRPVRMVCLFERGEGLALEALTMPASPLPLAPYMLGLQGDSERERDRFSLYADLMGHTQLVRITCDLDDRPSDLADLLQSTLAASSPSTAPIAS